MVSFRMQCTRNEPMFEGSASHAVAFQAVYTDDPNNPNRAWATATPGGTMSFTIDNPAASEQFVVGELYDFLASPSPKVASG